MSVFICYVVGGSFSVPMYCIVMISVGRIQNTPKFRFGSPRDGKSWSHTDPLQVDFFFPHRETMRVCVGRRKDKTAVASMVLSSWC